MNTKKKENDYHHTSMYEFGAPVYRRGVPFAFTIHANLLKTYFENFKFWLSLDGPEMTTFKLHKKRESDGWRYEIFTNPKNLKFTIHLYSSSNARIGFYHLIVKTKEVEKERRDFLLIFNPWNQYDDVFLDSEYLLSEYILSTDTNIYWGSKSSISFYRWKLDQFDSDTIRAAIYLLNKIVSEKRGSPIEVCRHLSALVNSNDDNGVLIGNWSGDYKDGINPNLWKRSRDILRQHVDTRKPVKYGQCWVFSGLLCSVLRAIGIPSRCITAFASMHDTDGSLSWEVYLDENLRKIDKGNDSCWNFHCWNEAWMKRPDIGKQYDGWQVLDATPQERSEGVYRLGPASKFAIKTADVNQPYDVGFVFAEVNALKIYYMRQNDGSFKQYMLEKDAVGKSISTKMVGHDRREDVTLEYKYDFNAHKDVLNQKINDAEAQECRIQRYITVQFSTPKYLYIHGDLSGSYIVRGMSEGVSTTISTEVDLVSYNGKVLHNLFQNRCVTDKKSKCIGILIDDFKTSNLNDSRNSFLLCKVSVYDPKLDEFIIKKKVINLVTPEVEISRLYKSYKLFEPIFFVVSIKNKFEKKLKDLTIDFMYTDYTPPPIVVGDLLQGETYSEKVSLQAYTDGLKSISVGYTSNGWSGLSCTESFKVYQ